MYFLVRTRDRAEAQEVYSKFRSEHIEYWNSNSAAVIVSGALLESEESGASRKGSLLLLTAVTRAELDSLIANDPFVREGFYEEDPSIEQLRVGMGEWVPTG